jgi:hypothetical protein
LAQERHIEKKFNKIFSNFLDFQKILFIRGVMHTYRANKDSEGLYICYVQGGKRGTGYNEDYQQSVDSGKNDPCVSSFRQEDGERIYGRYDGSNRVGNICHMHCDSLNSRQMFGVEINGKNVFFFPCYDPTKRTELHLDDEDFVQIWGSGSSGFFSGIVISKNPIPERTEDEWKKILKK